MGRKVLGPTHELSQQVMGHESRIGKVVIGQCPRMAELKEGLIRAQTKEPKSRRYVNESSDASSEDLVRLKVAINIEKKKGVPLTLTSIQVGPISDRVVEDFKGVKHWKEDGMTLDMIVDDLDSCDMDIEDNNISNDHFK